MEMRLVQGFILKFCKGEAVGGGGGGGGVRK